MLVLARRPQDKVIFPNLGITVHVLRIDGKAVRLGIDAPRDVQILRHEIADQRNPWPDDPARQRPKRLSHRLRNGLHAATVGLQLLRRQLETGRLEDDVESTILKVFQELESMEREMARVNEAVGDAPPLQLRRALLIEDNQNESELLAGYLRTCSFDVATARDGADALEYLADNDRPDVILLDMNMPRMDGPTTIHEIRSNPVHAGLKVFAVTGLSPHDARIVVGPTGVDRWFTKPVNPDVLVSEINRELAELSPTA